MKKILLPLFVLITCGLHAQTSTELGDGNEFKQFIPEKALMSMYQPISFNKKHELFVAYTECAGACNFLEPFGTLHVMKKSVPNWQEIGNLVSLGKNKAYPVVTFDRYDTAYIAFFDPFQISVMKFNGTSWVYAGNNQIAGDITRNRVISLVFDKNNIPYLSTRAEVYKLYNNNWVLIHANTGLENEYFNYTMLAPEDDTCIYLPVRSQNATNKVSVLRYLPSLNNWDTVGPSSVDSTVNFSYVEVKRDSKKNFHLVTHDSGSDTYLFSLTGNSWTKKIQIPNSYGFSQIGIDKYDSIYIKTVIQIVQYAQYETRIFKYNGSTVKQVGTNPTTPYPVTDGFFTLDSNGTPYLFYEYNNSSKLNICRLENDTQWNTITGSVSGLLGINQNPVIDPLVTVNPKTGLPFVMYAEKSNAQASILFWNIGLGKWTPQGAERFTSPATSYSVAIDTAGKTYCAFIDYNGHVTAKDFNGTSWVNTGSPDITSGVPASYTSMAITPEGTPYLAYAVTDGNTSKAQVKKYTGGTWQTVGNTFISSGNASYIQLVISESGTPYLIYSDDSLNKQAVVKKFDGNSWVNVGGATLGTEKAAFTSIAVDAHDTVYALFTNPDNGQMVVKKNTGSLWSMVGSQFNDSLDGGGSIGLDLANFPYVTYPDPAFEHKASIKWFNGAAWNYLGPPGFSAGRATKPVLTFDKNNNLYVAYTTGQAFARKFSNLVTGVHTATITRTQSNKLYPNPVTAGAILHLDVQLQDIGKTFTIYNLQGKIKYSGKLLFENNELNPDLFTKGIYLLRIDGSSAAYKLVVQE